MLLFSKILCYYSLKYTSFIVYMELKYCCPVLRALTFSQFLSLFRTFYHFFSILHMKLSYIYYLPRIVEYKCRFLAKCRVLENSRRVRLAIFACFVAIFLKITFVNVFLTSVTSSIFIEKIIATCTPNLIETIGHPGRIKFLDSWRLT